MQERWPRATIYLDGQLMGSGAKEIRVPFGSHYLRLCHKDIHLYHECLEHVEPDYFTMREINRTLVQKRGTLTVQIRHASKLDSIDVKKISIFTSNHNESKTQKPFYFSQIPTGKYQIFVDFV